MRSVPRASVRGYLGKDCGESGLVFVRTSRQCSFIVQSVPPYLALGPRTEGGGTAGALPGKVLHLIGVSHLKYLADPKSPHCPRCQCCDPAEDMKHA